MKFQSSVLVGALLSSSAGAFGPGPLAARPATLPSSSAPPSFGRPAFGLHGAPGRSVVTTGTSAGRISRQRHGPAGTALGLAGGGGPEALDDYIQTLGQAESKLSSRISNPKLVKLAGVATIPLTYALGAAMTPSRRLAARAVGGVLAAATAGGIGKSAVEEDVRRSCPSAIARRLRELGLDDPNVADGIARLAEDHDVDDEDFGAMKTEIYAIYLNGMAKNPLTKTGELKELQSLRSALGLTNQQVGQAHGDAAKMFYRDVQRFTTVDELDDEDHPDRISLDKLLFLTERALRQGGETDKAFTFEFSRVALGLGGLTVDEALERAKDVATPFYERALASTRAKLESGAVSPDMLSRARSTLGIEDFEAKEMHIESFAKEVRVQLGLPEEDDDEYDDYDADMGVRVGTEKEVRAKLEEMKETAAAARKEEEDTSGVKFGAGSYEHLSKLQEVFGLTDEDADFEIASATEDFWKQTALRTMEDAIAGIISPAKAWEVMAARQKELYIKSSLLDDMLGSIVIQSLGAPMERVNDFAKVNNAAATYNGLIDVIAAKETCKSVLKEAGWGSDLFAGFEAVLFDPYDSNSAVGFLRPSDRHDMYQIFFTRSIKPGEDGVNNISAEGYEQLKQLRGMLGISEEEGTLQIRNFFGPYLQDVLNTATDEILRGNTTDELLTNLRASIDKVISDYDLDDEMVRGYAGPLYSRAVENVGATTPGGIPSAEENDTLLSLRTLLGIADDEIADVHLRVFGPAYRKGIREALGTTGVIREEFRKPLDDLRDRLGMTDEAAREIYLEAIGERMKPMVEYISNEMERLVLTNDQLAQKRGADYGEDFFKSGAKASGNLGLGTDGNIMSDIMNLIDFYVENDVVQKEVVGTKKVEKTVAASEEDGGESKTVTEEEPVYESTYPITAKGLGVIDDKVAELCYRQFVVSSFTDQGPNAARYEASKATFGGILGLTAETMEEIGGSIGGMVYDNYITQALSSKPSLDQQDMMFLANIQGKLGISSEQGEEMLLKAQTKIVSEEASTLFGGAASVEDVKDFREKCNSMGLDLQKDVGLTKSRLINMFSMEITPGIDSGEITIDSADYLAEIQESLGLSEEEGEEVVSGLIQDRSNGILADIVGCMLRGNMVVAVESMERLVQYAAFVDGDLGLEISEENANKAFNLFDSKDWTGVDEDTMEYQKTMLKKSLNLISSDDEEETEGRDEGDASE
mmetsp:Transcript_34618/g.82695  ORF Transcript_34618/g.82695 Transcript_34618/m.82695 type:complete len:1212 (-) Transcript_34618:75-3710(-)